MQAKDSVSAKSDATCMPLPLFKTAPSTLSVFHSRTGAVPKEAKRSQAQFLHIHDGCVWHLLQLFAFELVTSS